MRQLLSDENFDFNLSPSVSLRIYADNRPYALQTRKLQKGAVLVLDGRELAEEGLGIGAPICLYEDGARFSLNAAVFLDDTKRAKMVTKIYTMNAIESKRFRGRTIRRGSFAARFLRILEKVYRRVRSLHVVATMMLDIGSIMGLRNEYVGSCSKGEISVSYEQTENGLEINVDFERLAPEGLRSLIIANEQGGSLFTEYLDSFGGQLKGGQIEPWSPTSAMWATLSSPSLGVGFTLRRPDGWRIVRGREVIENRMSWSGLNLVCDGIPLSKMLGYRFDPLWRV
jgi:hypothetical protein